MRVGTRYVALFLKSDELSGCDLTGPWKTIEMLSNDALLCELLLLRECGGRTHSLSTAGRPAVPVRAKMLPDSWSSLTPLRSTRLTSKLIVVGAIIFYPLAREQPSVGRAKCVPELY